MAPRFLSELHAELCREFGPDEARVVLQQIGFLHGSQDAQRVLHSSFNSNADPTGIATPPIAIRFHCIPDADPPGSIEFHGIWPDCSESSNSKVSSGSPSCGCALTAGYTSGWFSGVLETDLMAIETTCRSQGEGTCTFVAREAQVWSQTGDDDARALLDALPFTVLGELLGNPEDFEAPVVHSKGSFEAEPGAVYIWDSVMVIPYTGLESTLDALSLIGLDLSAPRVSVVVVDLTGCVIENGPEASNLAQIIRAIEGRNAEAIIAGAGPLAEQSVANLMPAPLFVEQEVESAIACAFRVADSQQSVS
ncbi:4-vinyl reductase [Myxococcota bacterium]|nr:4-vinyl reductase [Myxococcota bacterium]